MPYFCWHPQLSVVGNCRMCLVEVEGRGLDIACNMPVSQGMKVFTNSEEVQGAPQGDPAVHHAQPPGRLRHLRQGRRVHAAGLPLRRTTAQRSLSLDEKVRSTKFYNLSNRILLDNERCILCLRCTRFTHEVSKSMALGVERRGDVSNIRPVEDRPLSEDPYSDNIVDICPVGALLSRQFLHKSRVWYLQPTPSVCPGCARGCTVQIWHRKPEWKLKSLDQRQNSSIARVTPLENPAVNGPWICNKGRDLARIFERARADEPMLKGRPVAGAERTGRGAPTDRRSPPPGRAGVELGFERGTRDVQATSSAKCSTASSSSDWQPQPGERIEDDLLIRARQEPEHDQGARTVRPRASPTSRTAPTSCWSGAKASTSRDCRRRRGSSS